MLHHICTWSFINSPIWTIFSIRIQLNGLKHTREIFSRSTSCECCLIIYYGFLTYFCLDEHRLHQLGYACLCYVRDNFFIYFGQIFLTFLSKILFNLNIHREVNERKMAVLIMKKVLYAQHSIKFNWKSLHNM